MPVACAYTVEPRATTFSCSSVCELEHLCSEMKYSIQMNYLDWALRRKAVFPCPHSPVCGSDNVIFLTLQPLPPKLLLSRHKNRQIWILRCVCTLPIHIIPEEWRSLALSSGRSYTSSFLAQFLALYSFLLQSSASFLFKILFLSCSLKTIYTMKGRPSMFPLP